MKNESKLFVALVFIVNLLSSGSAIAQEKVFSLELNGAKDTENGCRLTYVAYNGTGTQLDKTAYEVVVFDKSGSVSQFLILEFGKLPQRKTKVVQFELKDSKCDNISRLLINDVSECEVAGTTVATCLDALKTKSRTTIGFGT
jgi:hypothetical protein